MRTLLLATVALIGLSAGAYAQTTPKSGTASNITASDSKSTIAPQLPGAAGDLTPNQYIMSARAALAKGRTGAAQEAIERAETRLLDRSTAPNDAAVADRAPRIESLRTALADIAAGKKADADAALLAAIRHRSVVAGAPVIVNGAGAVMAPAMPVTPAMPQGGPPPGTTSTMMQATSIKPATPGEVTGNDPAVGPATRGAVVPGTTSTMMQATSVKPVGVGASTTGSAPTTSLTNNSTLPRDDDPDMESTNTSASMNPGLLPASTPGTPTTASTPTSGGSNGGGTQ